MHLHSEKHVTLNPDSEAPPEPLPMLEAVIPPANKRKAGLKNKADEIAPGNEPVLDKSKAKRSSQADRRLKRMQDDDSENIPPSHSSGQHEAKYALLLFKALSKNERA